VNDLYIAGHAWSEGLLLVTNNVSEFMRVPAGELGQCRPVAASRMYSRVSKFLVLLQAAGDEFRDYFKPLTIVVIEATHMFSGGK